MNFSSIEELASRLERLEGQNRHLKFGAIVSFLGIIAIFIMGQAMPTGIPKVIEAQKFFPKDSAGKTRAVLATGDQEGVAVAFGLLDRNGINRAIMYLLNDGSPGIALKNKDETVLWVAPDTANAVPGNFVLWGILTGNDGITAVALAAGLTKNACEERAMRGKGDVKGLVVCLPESVNPIRK